MRLRTALLLAAVALGALEPSGAAASAFRPPPSAAAVDNASALYVLDGYGGVHPAAGSPAPNCAAYWPGWDVARGLAMLPDNSGGYVLDRLGGLHPCGGLTSSTGSPYWGWDIARSLVFAPWATAASPQGWVLDGYGGIHPFNGAPAITAGAYWQAQDVARGIAVLPDSTPAPGGVHGYTLDVFGGLHPFAGTSAVAGSAYWPGWNIARGIVVLPSATAAQPGGYVLDGYGGLHQFGSAPSVQTSVYWSGWDIARALVAWTGAPAGQAGGWVIDGYGGIHSWAAAGTSTPYVAAGAYWSGFDIARGASGAGSGSSAQPPPPPPKRKIIVSLSLQHLWAYLGSQLFLETDVTTGRPELPTPAGDYHIFYKASPYEMISPWPPSSPYYYPPTWISYAMEFIAGGYFLHDAPWRTWFGPGSQYNGDGTHGCVNIPGGQGWGPIYALWNWAQIGDEVVVQP